MRTDSSGAPLVRMSSSDRPNSSLADSERTFSLMSAERGLTQKSWLVTTWERGNKNSVEERIGRVTQREEREKKSAF